MRPTPSMRAGMAPEENGDPWQARQTPNRSRKWPGVHLEQRRDVYPGAHGMGLEHVRLQRRVVESHIVAHVEGGHAEVTGQAANRTGGGSWGNNELERERA